MEYKDYYKVLGLSREATSDEIKKAYRRLARKYHPDVSKEKDAEERFKEIGEAYDVLQDTKKREAYDRLGNQWKSGEQFTPPPDWQFDFGTTAGGEGFTQVDPESFSDFFANLFGGATSFREPSFHRHKAAQKASGQDSHVEILITLEDAFHGATKELTLQSSQGIPPKTLRVKIPKGVLPGQQIRLSGQGGPGFHGGPAGDLYIKIDYAPHPLYSADKADLSLKVPITPWEAALGASIAVPTLAGRVDVKIMPNAQSGQKLRLKGRGIPAKAPGDQYLILEIKVPPADTAEAKAFYEKMAKDLSFDPRKSLRGWE